MFVKKYRQTARSLSELVDSDTPPLTFPSHTHPLQTQRWLADLVLDTECVIAFIYILYRTESTIDLEGNTSSNIKNNGRSILVFQWRMLMLLHLTFPILNVWMCSHCLSDSPVHHNTISYTISISLL